MIDNNNSQSPLCVDLDGTLIRTDILQEMLLIYIHRWPYKIINIIIWLMRGRAYLKQQLALEIDIAQYDLPFNKEFTNWLKEQKSVGRQLILVTASDQVPANSIARNVGIFNDVMASDGQRNLRVDCKAQALVQRFGKNNFAYAGNSKDDLKVWAQANEIIAVDTPAPILKQAQQMAKPIRIFKKQQMPSVVRLLLVQKPRVWFTIVAISALTLAWRQQFLSLNIVLSCLNIFSLLAIYNLFTMMGMRVNQSKDIVSTKSCSSQVTALQTGDVTISAFAKYNIMLLTFSILLYTYINYL